MKKYKIYLALLAFLGTALTQSASAIPIEECWLVCHQDQMPVLKTFVKHNDRAINDPRSNYFTFNNEVIPNGASIVETLCPSPYSVDSSDNASGCRKITTNNNSNRSNNQNMFPSPNYNYLNN